MKKVVIILLIAALLCACTDRPKEPIIEIDMRAEQTPEPIETEAPAQTDAPEEAPATEAPVQTDPPQTEGYAQRVAAAWNAEGLLDGFVPYSEEDLLDLYGIDLSVCISGVGYAETAGLAVREMVLVEADDATASEVEQLLADHLESMKAQFRGYDPDAYALLETAVLIRDGGVVLMLVSPDAETLQRVAAGVDR